MTTLLISGSRDASESMLSYARACVQRAYLRGWRIYVGDAKGVDAAVAQAAIDYYPVHAEQPEDDLYIYCTVYGLDEKPRHGITGRGVQYIQLRRIEHREITGSSSRRYARIYIEECKTYKRRDEVLVNNSDKVMCIWNGTSKGTKAAYDFALQLGKECWLKRGE